MQAIEWDYPTESCIIGVSFYKQSCVNFMNWDDQGVLCMSLKSVITCMSTILANRKIFLAE